MDCIPDFILDVIPKLILDFTVDLIFGADFRFWFGGLLQFISDSFKNLKPLKICQNSARRSRGGINKRELKAISSNDSP